MPKIIQVPGVGNVEFPDEMGDDAIASAIKASHPDLGKSSGSDMAINAAKTAGSHLVDSINPLPGLAQMAMHPIDTVGNILNSHRDQFKQAYDALTSEKSKREMPSVIDRGLTAAGHAIAGSVPLIGPMAANIGEHLGNSAGDMQGNGLTDANTQEMAGAVGDAAGLALQAPAGKLLGKVTGKIKTGIANKAGDYVGKVTHANPLSPEALQFAEDNKIPVTVGDKTGSRLIQQGEKVLGHTLPGADIAAGVKSSQKAAVNDVATKLAGGMTEHPQDAVDNLGTTMLDRIKRLDSEADSHYDKFRDLGEKSKANPDDIAFPVDLSKAKAILQPTYDKLNKLNETFRHSDAGYRHMKDIMDAPDVVPADLAEQHLGKLKAISRDAEMPELRNGAQGLTARATSALQPEIDSAIAKASPDAQATLQNGRKTVAQKYETSALLKDLGYDFKKEQFTGNPMERLTSGKFSSYPLLNRVLQTEPSLQEGLGKAYLSDMFAPLMQEGGFGQVGSSGGPKVTTAATKWNTANPYIKNALFEPKHAQDISRFFEVAKRLEENPNGSNTGAANMVGHLLNGSGDLAALAHPGLLAGSTVAMRALTKILYNPSAVSKLNKVLTNGANSRVGRLSLSALREMNDTNGWYRAPAAISAQQSIEQQPNQ